VMVIRDITQRKKDEEEIKYQANLLNNVSDPIIATDLNCIITSWNKAAEGLYGYKTEESIGKLVKDVINSEFTNEQRKKALNCLNKGHSCPLELTQYAKDGKILYIESTTLPIYERDKVTGYVSVNHDITQHRKAEEVLKIKEEQLRISLEAAHAGMWIRDPIGEWIATPELNALFGRSIDDPPLLEEEFIDYIHPDDLPRIEKTWLSARNGESVYDEEYRVIWPDGSLHWLASKGKISSQEGMPRFIGITYDITQHKKAEEELKQAHDTLELKVQERTVELENAYDDLFDLYNNAPCGYHSLDKDAYFERINDTELSWLGYSREEIVGKKKFTDLITEESLKTFKKNYPSFIKKGYVNDLEFDMIRKDGSILPILLNATAIYDSNGNFLMSRSTLFDMTEHKKAEEELKRSNEELQQFAYVSSHDLQEPLRTIASFTQLLERRYKGQLDDNADEFMNYIVDATIRMNEQIQGLLEFSRVGTKDVKFEPVDMNLILNQTIQNLNLSIREANTEITHDELPTVIGNARQLQRVFQNLISNAIKFKKPDGSSKIHISAYKSEDGKEYVFSVSDNGIGMEKQYLERIFIIFQQLHTRDVYGGTGIGLSVVKRIVERHGGSV
ncbi:MAG: PAS domain-containing sensor histidine kinase, partial [Methanobacterium sp.]